MSGNNRIVSGNIAQSAIKGKSLENALAKALDNPTPTSMPKKIGKKKSK